MKKHTVGHFFVKTLKFNKFIADIDTAQEIRKFNNPESDENIMNNIPASQKMKYKQWQCSRQATMLDLQTCKIIDIVVEKTIMTPWLCHGLSYDNQILYRDSF